MKKSCLLSGMMMLGVIANVNAMRQERNALDTLVKQNNWDAIFARLNQMQRDTVNTYVTMRGHTLLIEAVLEQNFSAAETLLEKYNANPNLAVAANHPSAGGTTPLILACRGGQFAMVKLLLEHKADPYLTDRWGKTASEYAKDYPEILKLLRKRMSSAAAA